VIENNGGDKLKQRRHRCHVLRGGQVATQTGDKYETPIFIPC